MKTRYINLKGAHGVETVDEFPYNTKEERKEAARCLAEYRLADPSGCYYMSQRCTIEWKERD